MTGGHNELNTPGREKKRCPTLLSRALKRNQTQSVRARVAGERGPLARSHAHIPKMNAETNNQTSLSCQNGLAKGMFSRSHIGMASANTIPKAEAPEEQTIPNTPYSDIPQDFKADLFPQYVNY